MVKTNLVTQNSCTAQFKMVTMHSEKPIYIHPVSQNFPQHHLWNGSNVHLIDDYPLSSLQGRPYSASCTEMWQYRLMLIDKKHTKPTTSNLCESLTLPVGMNTKGQFVGHEPILQSQHLQT